jgi:hypothetical protein
MYKVIPQMVKNFDFEVVRGEGDEGTGYSWKTLWFTKQEFECVIKERASS